MAPALSAGADFAITKKPGEPCPNLSTDFGCGIHDGLRERGFPGCTVYDCFGAGQHVTQVTFAGRNWRSHPELAESMFDTFARMRLLHELWWYLLCAAELVSWPEIDDVVTATERLTTVDADELATVDLDRHRADVNAVLSRVSESVRGTKGRQLRGADLVGRRMRGADLRGANLRGALLIGADLTTADLTRADVIGADFRGARLHGADLRTSLFLTQAQADAAIGDAATTLPDSLRRPTHWH